ncbi:hypothetical protein [Celeribacter sp.]|uniref:hypothetical protein n=1 Tax=Celeribacter sp. TaxID=1890673 RepID=UPI003A8CED58
MWRIASGQLYKIMVKEDEFDIGHVLPFKPNRAQRDFLNALHYRNIILKARQLGFTTLIAIIWLDHALFVPDQRVGIIAHTIDDAEVIFRDKVKFAYDNMPAAIRARFPMKKETTKEILFAHNNSSIRVSTSMRSGTIHRLHISEMGKIAAKFPEKAKEIVTGSLPAVPLSGIAVIESTAEGQAGEFYDMATRAQALAERGTMPSKTEFLFHFYPWYQDVKYRLPRGSVELTLADQEYFAGVEKEMGVKLDIEQRTWYVAKRENDFSGDAEKMWREFPSTPEECWKKSTEGAYFAKQMMRARVERRITKVPYVANIPVDTFWDIGASDGTGIWARQRVQLQHRFLTYIEGWEEGYAYYVKALRETGWLFGVHYLPHDAAHKRQMKDKIGSPLQMLQELAPDWRFEIVPQVSELQHGITLTRTKLAQAWFDEEGCADGIIHIEQYHKKWNARVGAFTNEPEKLDGHSECADALRQWAQHHEKDDANRKRRTRPRASGMTA